jgi:zinc protease
LLVEDEGLVLSVDTHQDEGFDPGLVFFFLTLPPGGAPAAVEARVLEELQRVGRDGVSDAELAKARNIILADFWRGLATINGKAAAIGQHEVFHGNYESLFNLPDAIDAVTADELRHVAAEVFRVNNMTVGVLRAPADEGVE